MGFLEDAARRGRRLATGGQRVTDPDHPGRKIATTRVKATSCDLCHDHAEPSCVYACPHDAAHRVNPPVFFADLLKHGTPVTQATPVKERM